MYVIRLILSKNGLYWDRSISTIFCSAMMPTNKKHHMCYIVKPALSSHSKRRQKIVFKTDYRLIQVCIKLPFSLRSLFGLFLSGRLRQLLLYICLTYI